MPQAIVECPYVTALDLSALLEGKGSIDPVCFFALPGNRQL
jgi:hypothetical protein